MIAVKKQYKTANIFGLIVYSERNPHIMKVLKDVDYWNSLNARTPGWIVLAVKPGSEYDGGNLAYIYESFKLKHKDLPQLLILSISSDQTMMQRGYKLDDSNVENAYKSIEKTVDIVTTSLETIHPQYRSSTNVSREVIKALDAELASGRWKRVSEQLFKFISFLQSLRWL